VANGNNGISPIGRFWKLLEKDKQEVYQIYLYAVFNGLVNLSLPLGIQTIINFIQGGELSSAWFILVGVVLAGIAVTGILQVLQIRIVENIQQNVFARSSFEFAYRLPRICLTELDDKHTPELANRFFDTLTIQKGLPKILIDFSLATFQVFFGLIVLALYSPYFIILGAVLFLLLWLIFRFSGPRGVETSLKESKQKYAIAHWLQEVARTNKSFKLGGKTQLHLNRTDEITNKYLRMREDHFQVLVSQFKQFIGFKIILAAGLLIAGGLLVFQQQMNLGQFVAAEIIIILIINSVEKIIRVIDSIYDVLTALEKIGYVSDMRLDDKSGYYVSSKRDGISIEAIDVAFDYPNQKRDLIRNLNFKVEAKSKVLIAGESGVGKSTLLHLIAGLYAIEDGELLLDDIPVSNYDLEALYEDIGFYFPNNQLFIGSLYENITMGRDLREEQVFDTIAQLGLKQFIATQKNGIHTEIDPEGRRLPRRIVQKLLIARAVVHKPRLILMEDPLHLVQEEEKREIIDYLMSPEHNWTAVVVSNDAYWQDHSDQLIHMKNRADSHVEYIGK